jgi:hypothetical protein
VGTFGQLSYIEDAQWHGVAKASSPSLKRETFRRANVALESSASGLEAAYLEGGFTRARMVKDQ